MGKAKRIFVVGQSAVGEGVVAEDVAKQLGCKFMPAFKLVLHLLTAVLLMYLVRVVKVNSIKHSLKFFWLVESIGFGENIRSGDLFDVKYLLEKEDSSRDDIRMEEKEDGLWLTEIGKDGAQVVD